MVLTPEFSLAQDERFVYFTIRCPNVRASEMEMVIAGTEFHFWAEPYLLVLNFEHKLVDNEHGSAKYDIESGVFEAKLEKAVRGEDFPELVLLTTLKPKPKAAPKIEVLARSDDLDYVDEELEPTGYGFNSWATGFFENLEDVIPYVADIPEPDATPLPRRREMRMEQESEDFDPDQIINDFLNPQPYELADVDKFLEPLSPQETKKLYGFPRKEYLMSRATAEKCFFQIFEVVYGVVYDTAMFGLEGSCESHWTIAKLSATLSWFDVPESADDMILTLVRRTLAYPIYRSYDFAYTCCDKTMAIFDEGRPAVLKCLMKAHAMMEKGEHRWRQNRLYIEPMISWLQLLKQEEYDKYFAKVKSAMSRFPPQDAIDDQWCIELLEKYAAKQRQKHD